VSFSRPSTSMSTIANPNPSLFLALSMPCLTSRIYMFSKPDFIGKENMRLLEVYRDPKSTLVLEGHGML
jgi:hypothetical protein